MNPVDHPQLESACVGAYEVKNRFLKVFSFKFNLYRYNQMQHLVGKLKDACRAAEKYESTWIYIIAR